MVIDGMSVDPKAIRTDGEQCYPAILRTNRQIYQELLTEWYGSVYYRAYVNQVGFHFLGRLASLRWPPPRTLQYVRKLDLSISLKSPSQSPYVTRTPHGLYYDTEFLEKCFLPGATARNLQILHLRFILTQATFSAYRDKPEDLKKDLEDDLAPLRAVRGLSEVTYEQVQPLEIAGDGDSYISESLDQMLAVIHGYLRLLVIEMTSPNRLQRE